MSRRRLLVILIGGAALVLLAFVGVIMATSGSSSDELVIYSARSHYGEEEPFERFAKETGTNLTPARRRRVRALRAAQDRGRQHAAPTS